MNLFEILVHAIKMKMTNRKLIPRRLLITKLNTLVGQSPESFFTQQEKQKEKDM